MDTKNRSALLPQSSGAFDELLIVGDKKTLLSGSLGDSIKSYLTMDYEILNQSEPQQNVTYVSYENVGGLIKRHGHVMLLGTKEGKDPSSKFVKELLPQFKLTENDINKIAFARNLWAQPQMVCVVYAENQAQMSTLIKTNIAHIYKEFLDDDLPKVSKLAYAAGINENLEKQLQQYYHFDFKLPRDYQLAKTDGTFNFFRKDDKDATYMILMKVYPENELKFDNIGLLLRNKLGQNVLSDIESDFMMTDSTLGFVSDSFMLGDNLVYETRGLWRMRVDYKGGPFINYFIQDKKNHQSILIDGFVYAPGEPKRKLMRQLDAVMRSFSTDYTPLK